ncbi:MAG TPA: proton-conducting transporter membrane subunit [Clostridia bacterium]|nr:proton-conducting transporter membrane subunit [Clostridia bacterium]
MSLLFVVIPLFMVVALNLLYKLLTGRDALYAAMLAALAQVGLSVYCLVQCVRAGASIDSFYITGFKVDWIAATVLCIIGLIIFVTAVLTKEVVKKSVFQFANVLLLLMTGMNGIVMATDLFTLYVFIEVTSAASFILIAINKKRDELEGAFKYYLMSALATVMMLLSIALIFIMAGGTSFEIVGAYVKGLNGSYPPALIAAILLFVGAASIKSGVVPFHTWVPDAHSSAPSPVSVVLAGVVIKVSGVYALMRVYRDVFQNDPALGKVLMVLGILSILVGALGAIGQTDIKRMLAFSSVSQIGYIVLGVSTGSAIGLIGAMLHFFNHATFKSLLFVDAAAIITQTGTRDMNKLGGLGERMPVTSTSSVIALLSMAGIPPLSGFWSKLLVIIAVWRISNAAAITALLLSVLTLAYFLLLQKKVFFGKIKPELKDVKECAPAIKGVEILLSALNIIVGVAFPLILIVLNKGGLL